MRCGSEHEQHDGQDAGADNEDILARPPERYRIDAGKDLARHRALNAAELQIGLLAVLYFPRNQRPQLRTIACAAFVERRAPITRANLNVVGKLVGAHHVAPLRRATETGFAGVLAAPAPNVITQSRVHRRHFAQNARCRQRRMQIGLAERVVQRVSHQSFGCAVRILLHGPPIRNDHQPRKRQQQEDRRKDDQSPDQRAPKAGPPAIQDARSGRSVNM